MFLPKGRSWLLAPVVKGMCSFESIRNGTVSLGDIALMNDALAAQAENQQRAYEVKR